MLHIMKIVSSVSNPETSSLFNLLLAIKSSLYKEKDGVRITLSGFSERIFLDTSTLFNTVNDLKKMQNMSNWFILRIWIAVSQ